jgi:hypothetical protein
VGLAECGCQCSGSGGKIWMVEGAGDIEPANSQPHFLCKELALIDGG